MGKSDQVQLDWVAIQAQIIKKAWKDEAYLKRLREDPKAVFEEEASVSLPDNIKFNLCENKIDEVNLILPMNPEAVNEGELHDQQLEEVAGGRGGGGLLGSSMLASIIASVMISTSPVDANLRSIRGDK